MILKRLRHLQGRPLHKYKEDEFLKALSFLESRFMLKLIDKNLTSNGFQYIRQD